MKYKVQTIVIYLFLAVPALAQKSVECAPNSLFQIQDDYQYSTGLSVAVAALVNTPAVFPKSASSVKISTPFSMKCPAFTAVSAKNEFVFTGAISENFRRFISQWKEGDPILTSYTAGKIDLAIYGYFRYENIREDWNQERLNIRLVNNKIITEYNGYNIFLKSTVAGYKINSAPLKPLFFQGQLSQISHGPNDIVEIFVKGKYAQLSYLKIDFKRNQITVRRGTPFPG